MLIHEVIDQFLYNRRHGLAGSKGKAQPKTLITYQYALKPFKDFLQERSKVGYEEINAFDIRAYVEYLTLMLDTGTWSRSRYLITIKVLKGFFTFVETDPDCIEEGLKGFGKRLPVAGAFPRRDHIPSPQDLQQWKKAFQTNTVLGLRNWLIFCTLLETGMRREELASLKMAHLQLDNRLIYIPDGKTGSRTIAITEILARNMKVYLKRREKAEFAHSEYLFASCKSDVPSPNMVTKVFTKLREKANLPYITPHTMRHAFCTYYLSNGGSTERLRNMTGHKTYTAMLHYMHLAKVSGTGQKDELEKVSPLRMLDRK